MEKYQWKPGWRPTGVDAQVAGEELARIREKFGRVTAELVVRQSRAKTAPLHGAIFHVDGKEAARLHYEERARKIIQAVFYVMPHEEQPPLRAFQFVVRDADPIYLGSREVAENPELAPQVRKRLLDRMRALRWELAAWDEFKAVVDAIDDIEDAA